MKEEVKYSEELDALRYLVPKTGLLASNLRSLREVIAKERSFAEVFYPDRIARLAESVLRLLPESDSPDIGRSADLASVACLSRALVETYLMFFHLCAESVDEDELDLRRKIAFLHMLQEEVELSKNFGASSERVGYAESNLQGFREVLEKHPVIERVPDKKLKRVLAGKEVTYLSEYEIAKRAGLDQEFFRALYRILSTLSHPQLYGVRHEIYFAVLGRDTEEVRKQLSLILYLVNSVLGSMVNEILALFPALELQIEPKFRDLAERLHHRFPRDAAGSEASGGDSL